MFCSRRQQLIIMTDTCPNDDDDGDDDRSSLYVPACGTCMYMESDRRVLFVFHWTSETMDHWVVERADSVGMTETSISG